MTDKRRRRQRASVESAQSVLSKAKAFVTSADGRFYVFIAFLVLVGLTGGGSRSDIHSLVILRPASVLFAAYGLVLLTLETYRPVRVPLAVIMALLAVAALQLVPLPYGVWSSLPHRSQIAEMDALAGLGRISRPLTLVPSATWNTLFSLFTPLAAVILVAVQSPQRRWHIVFALAALVLVSVVFGLLQVLGARALYLYQITNEGYPVGLFSNRNHFALALAWLMPCVSWLVATDRKLASKPRATVGVAMLVCLFLPLLVLTGSRAGLVLGIPAIGASGWLLARTKAFAAVKDRVKPRWRRLFVIGLVSLALAMGLALVAILVASDRATSLSRLFETNGVDELRFAYLPIYLRMVGDFFPLGSGFGSFELLFYSYEPPSRLSTTYMNQAHNDLIQVILEGGLPIVLVLLAGCAWLARSCWKIFRSESSRAADTAGFLGFSVALWLAGSLVDYPLRTPLGATIFATLTALIGVSSRARYLSSGTAKV